MNRHHSSRRPRHARLCRHRRVRRVGRVAGGGEEADAGDLHLLRGGYRGRRRDDPRPADRRAGVLGAHQRHAADLHRRGARRLVPVAPGDRRARPAVVRRSRPRRIRHLWRVQGAQLRRRPVPAFAMGVITACVGGIIRDVLANEPSILMRPELYVTAAALASGLFVILALFGAPPALAALVAGLAGIQACAAQPLPAAWPAGLPLIDRSAAAQHHRHGGMSDEFYRIQRLPPYVFAEVNAMKAAARARGEDIVDLGMGNPDGAPPKHVIDKLAEVAAKPTAHRYSASKGIPGLRKAQAAYYSAPLRGRARSRHAR